MIALIDGDILVYRVGFASQAETETINRVRLEISINDMVHDLEAKDFKLYLTSQDRSNFRFQLFPEYKAHRVQPKPVHYLFLRNHMIKNLDALVVEGMEADDQLGIDQTQDTIICTIDKDLDQIPGWHYNFVKKRKYNISDLEAIRWFYWQVLVGDKTTDNVEGCPGIGQVKATRILEGCQDEKEMLDAVIHKYQNAYPEEWADRLELAGKLLWIRKRGKPDWVFGQEVVSKEMLVNYSKSLESNSSTSPIPSSTSSPPNPDVI